MNTKDRAAPSSTAWPRRARRTTKQVEAAYGRFINDTYWLLAPWKIFDPGVHLAYDGEKPCPGGGVCDVLKLSFENVGLTPKDVYWLWITRDGRRMLQWQYVLGGAADPPTTAAWKDWRKMGGLMLSLDKPMVRPALRDPFENVAVSPARDDSLSSRRPHPESGVSRAADPGLAASSRRGSARAGASHAAATPGVLYETVETAGDARPGARASSSCRPPTTRPPGAAIRSSISCTTAGATAGRSSGAASREEARARMARRPAAGVPHRRPGRRRAAGSRTRTTASAATSSSSSRTFRAGSRPATAASRRRPPAASRASRWEATAR